MKEENYILARAVAEVTIEPMLRIIKQSLIEAYMKGFLSGAESTEGKDAAVQRPNDEAEAFANREVPKEESLVRLKRDAILKRKLRVEDFNARVWNTLSFLGITTLGELLQHDEKFYRQQRNFGEGSLNIIKKFVKQFGYELKKK